MVHNNEPLMATSVWSDPSSGLSPLCEGGAVHGYRLGHRFDKIWRYDTPNRPTTTSQWRRQVLFGAARSATGRQTAPTSLAGRVNRRPVLALGHDF